MLQPFQVSGVGLHSGKETTVKVTPAEKGKGRYFIRTDLPNHPQIMANIDSVKTTLLSTELAANLSSNSPTVRTVEHLLASLCVYGLDDVQIEIDGAEVPLLDGSAQNWCQYFTDLPENNFNDNDKVITEPIWVRKDDAFVGVLPSPEMRFSYGIDFPYPVLQNQWYSWYPHRESFKEAIAPARTFGFADQIEHLKKNGLIKGGSLENALVCDFDGWVNPPLRFENEAVRHKLIDLVGDLSLLGKIPQAHYLAYKASHHLHTELARKIKQNLGLKC